MLLRKLLPVVWLALFFGVFSTSADVIINEISGSNATAILDEDGDNEDWVELLNTGTTPVNLNGYGLSDDPAEPFRWIFPNIEIGPGEHLIVWASGKDRAPGTGERTAGFVREYYWDVSGDFDDFIAGPELGQMPDSRDVVSGFFEAPTNVAEHYGIRMYGFLQAPMTGNYTFWIASDNGGGLYLNPDESTTVDYNDPIASIAARAWSAPRSWNEFDSQQSDPIFLEQGELYFISAVMKEDVGGDHLAVRWQLPDGTIEEPIGAGRIFLSEHQLHTNFSISKDGEPVQLTSPGGLVVDSAEPVALPSDVSYGRTTDGAVEWSFFEESTPGATNNTSTAYLGVLDPPEFSHESGFYTNPFALSLSAGDPNADIVYTLDGSEPDAANTDGTEYAYMNQYPNGELLYRSYRSFSYDTPLTIDEHQIPAHGIQDINTTTENQTWSIDGDEIVQTSLARNVRLMFGDTGWTDYELTLQAKKTGGKEGFLIFFRADGDDYYEFNIGGWGNQEHGLEKGYGGGNHTPYQDNIPGSIESDVWYDIRIRADGHDFECWFDGELLFDFDDYGDPNLHGQVGIGTWETQARFRNIEIRELAEDGGDLLFSGLPIPPAEPRDSIITTVRARAERPGYISSPIVSHTYFVDPDIQDRFSFPVISIAGNESDFFSYEDGIYVAGEGYVDSNTPHYLSRGMAWERPVHVTMFEPGGDVGFSQLAGTRIHGGWTRNIAQKSLRLYARGSVYGESYFEHEVFPDQPFDAYKRLLLRNSGNDYNRTMFADAMMQRLVEHLRFDTQAYRPAVVFINGEYWGIQNLRERYDKHYLERTYGVDPEAVDILEFLPWLPHGVKEGTDTHFADTLDYIETHGVADPADYEYIKTRIDLENYIDYNAAQIYLNNSDWPGNNNDFWRAQRDEYDPLAPYGLDGRWRWMLFDTDFGFGGNRPVSFNLLEAVNEIPPEDELDFWNQPPATFLFRNLLESSTFRNDFINRMADLMNTAFLPERVASVIDEMAATIEPEIEKHIDRWGTPSSKNSWLSNISRMHDFGDQRPFYMRQHLMSEFGIAQRSLTVDVSDPAAGHVRVNTIDIHDQTPGIGPNPYPWTGAYFNVPLEITAIPAPGYRFVHWQELTGSQDADSPTITVDFNQNEQFTAVFEEAASGPSALVHYWHFTGLSGDDITRVPADHSILGNAVITYPGTGAGYMDDTDGSDLNLRLGQSDGEGLRVRNPSDTRELLLTLPTTGYEQIQLSYAVRRTGSGAPSEVVEYMTEPGGTWTQLGEPIVVTEDYQLFTFDFSAIPEANDNPDFRVRILFGGENASGDDGNNRFDNIALDGVPQGGTQPPPELTAPIPSLDLVEEATVEIDLDNYFSTTGDDPLLYTVSSNKPGLVDTVIDGSTLTLSVPDRGDVTLTVSADDTLNPAVETSFHVMIHPEAHVLANGDFSFGSWSNLQPENTYPENMLFLQSDEDDPKLLDTLEYTYFIPHDDYNSSDTIGFPYNNEQRSRINGLGENGISFINTGRGRDVGAALVAIDTSLLEFAQVTWTAGTLAANSRTYNIRLQYRTSVNQPFADLLDENGDPVEYQRAPVAGDVREIGPVTLPAAALGKPYVQLLWRYYYTDVRLDEIEGSRDELRLDEIHITGEKPPISAYDQWREAMFPDPADASDPAVSGPHADPLGQGITNLMRYAFDISFEETSRNGLPQMEVAGDGSLSLSFFFREAAADLDYIVEGSDDLATWTQTIFDSRADLANPDGAGLIHIDVSPPPSAPKKFFRVRILYEAPAG